MVEEEVKYIVNNAINSEFSLKKDLVFYSNYLWVKIYDIQKWYMFPLLLYKAVEGFNIEEINNRTGNAIYINPEEIIAYYNDETILINYDEYSTDEFMTAKEKSIMNLFIKMYNRSIKK